MTVRFEDTDVECQLIYIKYLISEIEKMLSIVIGRKQKESQKDAT